MRLSKDTLVCGVDPQIARRVAKYCNTGNTTAETLTHRMKVPLSEARNTLASLTDGGFLTAHTRTLGDGRTLTTYATTTSGGALAQASFSNPLTRTKADELLKALCERAHDFNQLPDKPLFIDQLTVFGSYLDNQATSLGDLDIHATFSYRAPEYSEPSWLLDYADESARTFNTIIDALGWAEREATLYLRNRNSYINITTENLDKLTDRKQTVYTRH